MSGKKHKREIKRQKELQKEQLRREERRRTLITLGIIALVIVIGGGLVYASVSEERRIESAAACGATKPSAADEQKPTFGEAPEMALRDGDYTAVITTSCGTLEVDLYEELAPTTVNNFVALSAVGFYDGLQIFRNAPSIFALQTGAANNQADFQIGYTFADELKAAEDEGYKAGSLAMANSGPNTNGSQFFFTYGDSGLPPQYSKFGQVTKGLDELKAIGAVAIEGETPTEQIYIESVRILVDGKDLEEILKADDAKKPSATPSPTAKPSDAATKPADVATEGQDN